MTTYMGVVQNGQIHLEGEQALPEGTRVVVTVVGDNAYTDQGITAEELLNSGLVGMWADRDDIGDTAEFVDKLRRRGERRD